jgi:hypothetical protein
MSCGRIAVPIAVPLVRCCFSKDTFFCAHRFFLRVLQTRNATGSGHVNDVKTPDCSV